MIHNTGDNSGELIGSWEQSCLQVHGIFLDLSTLWYIFSTCAVQALASPHAVTLEVDGHLHGCVSVYSITLIQAGCHAYFDSTMKPSSMSIHLQLSVAGRTSKELKLRTSLQPGRGIVP